MKSTSVALTPTSGGEGHHLGGMLVCVGPSPDCRLAGLSQSVVCLIRQGYRRVRLAALCDAGLQGAVHVQ